MSEPTPDPAAEEPGGPVAGEGLIRFDVVGTAVFVVATLLASVVGSEATELANLAVSVVLFLGGTLAFTVGFVLAAGRSREESIHLAGLFYLTGSAPARVRRLLLGLWYAQIAVATVSVFTTHPPFGVMAPVWGIGILTAWGARHGRFPPRTGG